MAHGKELFDIFVIGGGINGCGIARDASGRGLKVGLAETNDLASATSSASTKLFHGGLRYLEYFEFRLVREALKERETLLRAMPHISKPMRFILPYNESMRFEGGTPTSNLLNIFMPWLKGKRPAWLIRFGLFLYDSLGGRKVLPATSRIDLQSDPAGMPLKDKYTKAYEYSDCWVDDARLVILNATDAKNRGATIMVQTKVIQAHRTNGVWEVQTDGPAGQQSHFARALVNAGGPWVENVIRNTVESSSKEGVRLVRGSHIVTRRLFAHDRAYFFQGTDGRIIFAIPYEGEFTCIGTTDQDHKGDPSIAKCSREESDYLRSFAGEYFKQPIAHEDIIWTYSGVRPLYDDGAKSATAATREYVLSLDETGGAPLLNVFGGKITTYRKLAEAALDKILPCLSFNGAPWTAGHPLPGGDFPVDGRAGLSTKLKALYSFLEDSACQRLIRTYGTLAFTLLNGANSTADLGQNFGHGLFETEVRWLIEREFATSAQDILWRRTKLGLHFDPKEVLALEEWMSQHQLSKANSN